MATLHGYLLALFHNWALVMRGGPFLVERLAKWFSLDHVALIARRFPHLNRHHVVITLSVRGLVVAGFLAFNDERNLLNDAKAIKVALPEVDTLVTGGFYQSSAISVHASYTVILSSTPNCGVILNTISRTTMIIKNISPILLFVYPPKGAAFEGMSVNSLVSLTGNGGSDTFVCVTPTRCLP